MAADLERMLRRVLTDVLDADVEVTWDTVPHAPLNARARLSAPPQPGTDRRSVVFDARATGWFGISVPDLDIGAVLFEYDDESYMEAVLRELALVADAYLRGAGVVEQKRGIVRTRPVLVITVNGNEWTLGRRTWRAHYPEDTCTGGSPS